MPAANQFTWNHKELITLMVKAAEIHEGRWGLLLNYGMTPGNFGISDAQLNPGLIVAVLGIGIQREPPGITIPSSMVVDAAEVNPARPSEAPEPPSSRSHPTTVDPSSPPEPSRRARLTRRERS
jgi:hypothetical protein